MSYPASAIYSTRDYNVYMDRHIRDETARRSAVPLGKVSLLHFVFFSTDAHHIYSTDCKDLNNKLLGRRNERLYDGILCAAESLICISDRSVEK